ncbi:unnamed protein product, partial [Discosporangium mesarthrocarpum]
LGLTPHALLYLSAQNPQRGSWGDLSSAEGFLRHILRQEYGTRRWGQWWGEDGALGRIVEYIMDTGRQTMYLGPGLAAVGIAWCIVEAAPTAWARAQGLRGRKARGWGPGAGTGAGGMKMTGRGHPSAKNGSGGYGAGNGSGGYEAGAGAALLSAWLCYVVFWHSVMSNLSLRHPMSRAVHSRFWMQPNLLLCQVAGVGMGVL